MRTLHDGLRVTDLDRSLAFSTAVGYEVVGEVPETGIGHLTMLKLPGDDVSIELVHVPDLGQRPGASNAELARATFVTRQAMNGVLRGLQERGLVTRPASAPHGRALPTRLTPGGQQQLHAASAAVRGVVRRMLAPLTGAQQRRLRDDLAACTAALTAAAPPE